MADTNTNTIQIQNINNDADKIQTVDVLYQKMGDRWYAFSLVGDEVFMGSVSQDEINQASTDAISIEKVLIEPSADLMNEVA
jgi:hypothetical protein